MQNTTAGEAAPLSASRSNEKLSPWWRRASLITMALGFAVLILLTTKVYHEAPPIPEQVTGPDGSVLFTSEDVRNGRAVSGQAALLSTVGDVRVCS